jgi:hypothetical protein
MESRVKLLGHPVHPMLIVFKRRDSETCDRVHHP